MKFIVPKIKSRIVTRKDFWRVLKDSITLKRAMKKPFDGKYPFVSSISHCQVWGDDPLRFFVVDREGGVTNDGVRLKQATKLSKYFGFRTIINPEVVSTAGKNYISREGCMSFQEDKTKRINRWEIVELRYQTLWHLIFPFLSPIIRKFYLYRAAMIQHELDHMDTVTIYDRWKHKINKNG